MFKVILGCIHCLGHIDTNKGIFGILEEKILHLERETPIPANSNTSCKCRRTPQCNIDCPKSVYGIMAGGIISWRNEGVII